MREAVYSEQAAMPPWFLAAASGLWRGGRGLECLQVKAVSVPDSLPHLPVSGVSLCLTASCLGFLFAGTSKLLEKSKLLVLYNEERKHVKY